jgi:hypothetical protein
MTSSSSGLWKERRAAKRKYDALSKAISGETDDEQRARLAAGARTMHAMGQAWIKEHPGHTVADFDQWGSCAATPEQERHWNDWVDRFDRKAAVQAEPSSSEELAEAKREIATLGQELAAKAHIAKLTHEMQAQARSLRAEASRRAAKPKAEKPPLPQDEARDRRIKALTTEVRDLKAQLRHMQEHYAARTGVMSRATRNAIDWVLQPDQRSNATAARWGAAAKAWNAWKSDNNKVLRNAHLARTAAALADAWLGPVREGRQGDEGRALVS